MMTSSFRIISFNSTIIITFFVNESTHHVEKKFQNREGLIILVVTPTI